VAAVGHHDSAGYHAPQLDAQLPYSSSYAISLSPPPRSRLNTYLRFDRFTSALQSPSISPSTSMTHVHNTTPAHHTLTSTPTRTSPSSLNASIDHTDSHLLESATSSSSSSSASTPLHDSKAHHHSHHDDTHSATSSPIPKKTPSDDRFVSSTVMT
jgi:hypothetical protein